MCPGTGECGGHWLPIKARKQEFLRQWVPLRKKPGIQHISLEGEMTWLCNKVEASEVNQTGSPTSTALTSRASLPKDLTSHNLRFTIFKTSIKISFTYEGIYEDHPVSYFSIQNAVHRITTPAASQERRNLGPTSAFLSESALSQDLRSTSKCMASAQTQRPIGVIFTPRALCFSHLCLLFNLLCLFQRELGRTPRKAVSSWHTAGFQITVAL